QFCRLSAKAVGIARAPAEVDAHVAADRPAGFLQPLQERRETRLSFRIVWAEVHEHADPPDPFALLRARRERPGRRRAAEQRDEFPSLQLIELQFGPLHGRPTCPRSTAAILIGG